MADSGFTGPGVYRISNNGFLASPGGGTVSLKKKKGVNWIVEELASESEHSPASYLIKAASLGPLPIRSTLEPIFGPNSQKGCVRVIPNDKLSIGWNISADNDSDGGWSITLAEIPDGVSCRGTVYLVAAKSCFKGRGAGWEAGSDRVPDAGRWEFEKVGWE